MNEIEQLKNDLETLVAAKKVQKTGLVFGWYLQSEIARVADKIEELEAQQAQADEWADSRMFVQEILADSSFPQRLIWLARYARHLEAKVAELENELRCERIDGGKVRDDLRAEIAELKAKTEREQLELCKECSHPLSDCGPLGVDGTPTADCKVCQLKAQIAEMEQHGRKVDQANHEHYGRLQDQIAIRDLKIEKLERQAPAERNRENLAELVTIQNAIPPACGLARELVEQRIEGVKKEMQKNGN